VLRALVTDRRQVKAGEERLSGSENDRTDGEVHFVNEPGVEAAGQLRCLPNPTRHELFVELVVLVNVYIAHFLVLGLSGRKRTQ
jgi:hypothetical protein